MTLEVILTQIIVPLVTALLGGAAVHVWHTSGSPTASNGSPPRASPTSNVAVPLAVPSDLFPRHPLLSHLVSTYGDELEAALLDTFKGKLGLAAVTPTATTAATPITAK